jgi:ribulose 1,5-bisphosphate carboxylase large subunit-like protein
MPRNSLARRSQTRCHCATRNSACFVANFNLIIRSRVAVQKMWRICGVDFGHAAKRKKKERKKLKEVSTNIELPILLNTNPDLQQMAEIITTGRQHGKAKLETRRINQSGSRQLDTVKPTSRRDYSFGWVRLSL